MGSMTKCRHDFVRSYSRRDSNDSSYIFHRCRRCDYWFSHMLPATHAMRDKVKMEHAVERGRRWKRGS